jgi:hypothetical protein
MLPSDFPSLDIYTLRNPTKYSIENLVRQVNTLVDRVTGWDHPDFHVSFPC